MDISELEEMNRSLIGEAAQLQGIVGDEKLTIEEILKGVPGRKVVESAKELSCYLINRNEGNLSIVWDVLDSWNSRNVQPLDTDKLRKILDSVSQRKGVNGFTQDTGVTIESMEILRYPDGLKEYRMKIKGCSGTVAMTPAEVQSPAKFELRLLQLTDHLYAMPRKLWKWQKLINPLLDEATRIDVSEEETELATLNELVQLDLDRGGLDPEEPGKMITRLCVSVSGITYFRLTVFMKTLEVSSLKFMKRKQVTALLKLAGFAQKETPKDFHDNCGSHRVWERKA